MPGVIRTAARMRLNPAAALRCILRATARMRTAPPATSSPVTIGCHQIDLRKDKAVAICRLRVIPVTASSRTTASQGCCLRRCHSSMAPIAARATSGPAIIER